MGKPTYPSAASALNGCQHQQAVVSVDRLSHEQVQAAQKATAAKAASAAGTLGPPISQKVQV